MSGHSKWNNIKRKKEKTDAQRGRIFTKIGREIAVAVKAGGPDPVNNARLGDVIAKAKAANMPNDTINRSIKRAAGEDSAVQYDEITYDEVLARHLAVMDTTATSLSMDNHIPVQVFALKDPQNILRVVMGEPIGTIVKEEL